MARLVILFEDHTAQQFRPLSWSLPVYEIPCGLFNLRERVQHLAESDQDPFEVALLPRGLLQDLQTDSAPPGVHVGPGACLAALTSDVLFLSARWASGWSDLVTVLAGLPMDGVRGDAHGLIAWRTSADTAREVLDSWRSWDETNARQRAWTEPEVRATVFEPAPFTPEETSATWGHLWDLVHDIGDSIRADTAKLADGVDLHLSRRHVFGIESTGDEPAWCRRRVLRRTDQSPPKGVSVQTPGELWLGKETVLGPGVVIDTTGGPVVIDSGVRILPHVYLEGPLYLGCDARVKSGATIYGETAVGAGCRIAGEIAESQLLPYMNKQHAGFLGHSVVGSWVNLGADTTNSDLKNNYGEIKVNYGHGPINTGSRFVGLMMGDHAKSAIGTTFNTGTTVGFSSNVFASGFPRTYLANLTWGDGRGRRFYDIERALEVARIVMSRRGCRFSEAHEALFRALARRGAPESGA